MTEKSSYSIFNMITYEYKCEACEHQFEIKQSIKDKPLEKCPECKKKKLYRLIGNPTVFIQQDPTTVGHLADRNTENMSKGQREDRERKDAESRIKVPKKEKPWWKSDNPTHKIASLTPQQKERYIREGKLP